VYKAPTVATPASVITTTLRIHGQLHTPPQADLASVMNHSRPFFPMTGCTVYKPNLYKADAVYKPGLETSSTELELTRSDFLIVPKETVLWIAEPETDDLEVRRSYRNLYLLYSDYILKGEVNVPSNLRISDFLTRAVSEKPFQYLYRVEVRLPESGRSLTESKVGERLEVALVNLRKVAGFYDISEDSSKPDLSGF
jgi:hypothetical protein